MKRYLLFLSLACGPLAPNAFGGFPLSVSMHGVPIRAGEGIARIEVKAPETSHLEARILDTRGHMVAYLQPSTDHAYIWDGRDSRGRRVQPGLYLVEVVEEPYLWNGSITVIP